MFTTTIFTLLTLIVVIVHGFAVTGTQGGVNNLTGSRPLRMDIEKFKYAGPAWDLYILALQHFYQTNQSEQLSYYQIAGEQPIPGCLRHVLKNLQSRYSWLPKCRLGRRHWQWRRCGILYAWLDTFPDVAPSLSSAL